MRGLQQYYVARTMRQYQNMRGLQQYLCGKNNEAVQYERVTAVLMWQEQ